MLNKITINCSHLDDGKCNIGKHNGSPTPEQCLVCRSFTSKPQTNVQLTKESKPIIQRQERKPSGGCGGCGGTKKKIIHGAKQLANAAVGNKRPSDKIIKQRRKICEGCEFASNGASIISSCSHCGCNILAKTALTDEKCPVNKWDVVKSED